MEKDEHGNVILSKDDIRDMKRILTGIGVLYIAGGIIRAFLIPKGFYGWIKVTNEH